MPDGYDHPEDQTTRIPVIPSEEHRERWMPSSDPQPHEHSIPEHRHDKIAFGDGIAVAGIWLSSGLVTIWLSRLIFMEWRGVWQHLDWYFPWSWIALLAAVELIFLPLFIAMRMTSKILKG